MIKKLTEREHIIQRPSMYIGAVDPTTIQDYALIDEKIQYTEISYIPALIKIINEVIDNSVDVAIKTNFKFSNVISVKIDDNSVEVQDNGTGIPVVQNSDGHYLPELAWGHARAGSNFDDDKARTQIGMNGIGSFATNCFSTKFVGKTDDGKFAYSITFKDNAGSFKENVTASSGETGTTVKFNPDFSKFNITKIDEVHQNIIKQRLINLSITFPEITFKFNGKKVNTNSFKKYVGMFSEVSEVFEDNNLKFAILPNDSDDFKQFSYVNGLKIPDGGVHIDIVTNTIVNGLRDKLVKKFKSIKPGDIRNKLMIVMFIKNFPNTKFNSQSKEKLTNSMKEFNDFVNGSIDYDKIINKIMKTPEIIDPITEVYRIKEEFKKRQELKALDKTVKKIKSDKYLPSIGRKKYLMIVEGESALGGTLGVFGRTECGYYILKGKPLNAYSSTQAKFVANAELSELYKVVTNEGYDYILTLTDQDLDGIHIRGLLTGFIHKYLPDFKSKFGMLQTPVIGITKNEKMVRWYYNLSENISLKSGEKSNYFKGLGSWVKEDLQQIVQTDGLEKMIDIIDFNNDEIIDDWLSDTKSDKRKEYIQGNVFSIAKA